MSTFKIVTIPKRAFKVMVLSLLNHWLTLMEPVASRLLI